MSDNIQVTDLDWLPLEFVCFNLKPADKADIFGQAPTDNPLEIAAQIMRITVGEKGMGWNVVRNGRPEGAFGVYQLHNGVWEIWSLGIEGPAMAMSLLSPLFEKVLPHIREHGGWRLQCKSRCDRVQMRDLLRLLGFKIEGKLERYGKDGSDYYQYAYQIPVEEAKEAA